MSNLEDADILVLLKTRNADNSIWVGFELGYFWKKLAKQNVFVLNHPKARLMSPIDVLQSKSIFDESQLDSFFEQLCKVCKKTYQKSVNIAELVGYANDYIIDPMAERSLERFEYLIENADWSKNSFDDLDETWVCIEDVLFQITYNINHDVIIEEFREPWTEGFPNPRTSSYRVHLKIGGITAHQVVFVGLDGGRYFVPLPKQHVTYKNGRSEIEERFFYWIRSSFEFKLGKLISVYYYDTQTIDEFVRRTGVKILDEPPT